MWCQTCGNMASIVRKVTLKKKQFVNFELSWGKFWPLRTLRRNLHMFLDIFGSRIENKQKMFRDNCFENLVSGIYKKNQFCPQNPLKIVNVFIVFFYFILFFFLHFFSKQFCGHIGKFFVKSATTFSKQFSLDFFLLFSLL